MQQRNREFNIITQVSAVRSLNSVTLSKHAMEETNTIYFCHSREPLCRSTQFT